MKFFSSAKSLLIRQFLITATHQAGYTLVELLIYFALVSVLFVQLSSLFISVLEAKKDSHAVSAVEGDGQYIFSRLMYDIERADQIIEPVSLGATGNRIQLTINGINYTYELVDSVLTLTRDGQPLPLHTATIASDFSATRLGNVGGKHSLRLQFRLTSPIQETSGAESQLYQTTTGLR